MDARAWGNHSRSVPRSSTFAVDSVAFCAAAVCGRVWRFLHQHCCPSSEMAEMAENPGPYAENYQSVSNAVYGGTTFVSNSFYSSSSTSTSPSEPGSTVQVEVEIDEMSEEGNSVSF